MPELPEVEVIKNNLSEHLVSNTIKLVEVREPKLRYIIPYNFIDIIQNQQVIKIDRIAKYILIRLINNKTILVHLGMTGNFIIDSLFEDTQDNKHNHVNFIMSNDKIIRYIDIRKFGYMNIFETNGPTFSEFILRLGEDALSKKFNTKYLMDKIRNKNISIKCALLDQKIVGGVGNIYASEALFKSNISPYMKCNELVKNKNKILKLIKSIKEILNDAIEVGGSTIQNHKNIKGEIGYFQYKFKVYNRENMTCKNKGCNSKIKKIRQTGRSTFFCQKCQA